MLSNVFNAIKLEFEGFYYGGKYEIEIFSDGRFYYSYIENDSIEMKKGSIQITQKELLIFEEIIEYFEFLKTQRSYLINEYRFGNSLLIINKKNGREEKIQLGKEMLFEYTKILIDKYTLKQKQIFLLDTYLDGTKYIRNFHIKIRNTSTLDLFREYNGMSVNSVVVFNQNKEKVGYIPKDQSEIFARLIDSGKKLFAIPIQFEENTALKVYMLD